MTLPNAIVFAQSLLAKLSSASSGARLVTTDFLRTRLTCVPYASTPSARTVTQVASLAYHVTMIDHLLSRVLSAAEKKQQEREEYQLALAKALHADNCELNPISSQGAAGIFDEGSTTHEAMETKSTEPSASATEDPYMIVDSMDEGEEEGDSKGESGDDEDTSQPKGHGGYTTISNRNNIVHNFFTSGLWWPCGGLGVAFMPYNTVLRLGRPSGSRR